MKNKNCYVQFLGIKLIDTALTVLRYQFKKAKYGPGIMGASKAFLKCLQKLPSEKISPSDVRCQPQQGLLEKMLALVL